MLCLLQLHYLQLQYYVMQFLSLFVQNIQYVPVTISLNIVYSKLYFRFISVTRHVMISLSFIPEKWFKFLSEMFSRQYCISPTAWVPRFIVYLGHNIGSTYCVVELYFFCLILLRSWLLLIYLLLFIIISTLFINIYFLLLFKTFGYNIIILILATIAHTFSPPWHISRSFQTFYRTLYLWIFQTIFLYPIWNAFQL